MEQFQVGTSAKDAASACKMPAKYKDDVDQWRVTTNVQVIDGELNHEEPKPFKPWKPWWQRWKIWQQDAR